jgi:glyoxylase-like metal-dependent hydrolase (beta-lactamase superfamily II)
MSRLEVPGHDVVGITAANPGPFTLGGTNSWVVGHDPAWMIDPGPALRPHVAALAAEIDRRGGLAGVALTHDHSDHAQAVSLVQAHYPEISLAGARGAVDVRLKDGDEFGPFTAVATPGHAADHLSYVTQRVGFTGDAVLGEGSVFVWPYPGALTAYLDGLRRLARLPLDVLCPGHGPVVQDPHGKLEEYVAHRLDREQRLLDALQRRKRSVDELLDDVWWDVPPGLRPAAAWTLAAHLDKLDEEGRLPAGVQRPEVEQTAGRGGA